MKPASGPDDNDLFRFTWHNTPNEARVWIDYRGKWREGVIIERGRATAPLHLTDTELAGPTKL